MRKRAISVTDAARNFADCLNRVRYQGAEFVLLKNGTPIARLLPEQEKVCSGRSLAEALVGAELPGEEAKSWRRDLRSARKNLKPPVAKWR